jgi:Ca-activated chloride channel family protein
MEANYLNSRGEYYEAIASYKKALEYTEAAPYAEYGIGSVFHSLGEDRAALGHFADCQAILGSASLSEHRELRYRNSYNSGLALFGEGDFPAAAIAFRNALKADPRRIEAKRNLELTLLSIDRKEAGGGFGENQGQENEARAAIFEYIRAKEQSQWKSREWAADDKTTGPDY